jgi:hypothetical protein
MSAHPLLFMAPMVRAIRAGQKTQTRRIISPKNSTRDGWPWPKEPRDWTFDAHDWAGAYVDAGPSPAGNAGPYLKVPLPTEETVHRVYPRYQVGDTVWGKETFCFTEDGKVAYFADSWTNCPAADGKWKPLIFMGRKHSRFDLPIVSVRPERLQAISGADAIAEGIDVFADGAGFTVPLRNGKLGPWQRNPEDAYRNLWEVINGPGSWATNPWVWVIEFRGIKA